MNNTLIIGTFIIIFISINSKAQNTGDNNINKLNQAKASNGIDFYALGNEPFWSLDMDFENEFQFKNLDGLTIVVPAEKGVKAMDAEVTRYRSVNESHELIIQVHLQNCSDTMSDNNFNYKVSIDYKKSKEKDYTRLSGCGNFVPDYRLHNIWAVESVENENLKEIEFMKGQPFIDINMTEYRISGHDGCNNIMGGFRYEKGYLIIGNLAGTMMACPNMEISNQISKTLNNKKIAYEFREGKLHFIYQNKIIMTLNNID